MESSSLDHRLAIFTLAFLNFFFFFHSFFLVPIPYQAAEHGGVLPGHDEAAAGEAEGEGD